MDRIRAHAREEAKRTSMREVSRRAGVTLGSTKKFLDGAQPYEQNARLWTAWMVREIRAGLVDRPDESVSYDDAADAMDVVLWAFTDEEREKVYPEAIETVRLFYERHGKAPPTWIRELAARPPVAGPSPTAGRTGRKRRR